jgi:hypothetical protein
MVKRQTDNAKAKRTTRRQTMIERTLHRKLKFEPH